MRFYSPREHSSFIILYYPRESCSSYLRTTDYGLTVMRPGRLACVLLFSWAASTLGAGKEPAVEVEPALKAAGVKADGPGLVDFFWKRTRPDADRDRIQGLIRQLGDGPPPARDRAAADLVALGVAAVPLLRQA